MKGQQTNSANATRPESVGPGSIQTVIPLPRPILYGWVGADEEAVEVVIADGARGAPNREFAWRQKLCDLRFDALAPRSEQA